MFPALNWYHLSRGYLVTTIFINKTHIFSFSFLSTLSWEIDCKMWKCCEEGTRTLSFSTAIKWGVTEAGVVKETKVKFRWFESWEVWEGWETLVIKYNYCQPASLPLETRLSHLTAPRTLSNINHILSFSSHSAGPVVSIISCFCSQQILLWSNILDYWKCWISNDASLNFSTIELGKNLINGSFVSFRALEGGSWLQFKTGQSNITPVIVNVNIFACSPGTSGWKINVSMIGTGNSHQPVISISGRVLFPKYPSHWKQGIFKHQSCEWENTASSSTES